MEEAKQFNKWFKIHYGLDLDEVWARYLSSIAKETKK